jgi:hypothetical protein
MSRAIANVRNNRLIALPDAADEGIVIGSTAWLQWLEAPTSSCFKFDAENRGFTARREQRPGGWYWYAYRRTGGRVCKAYLGRAADLTRIGWMRCDTSWRASGLRSQRSPLLARPPPRRGNQTSGGTTRRPKPRAS